MRLSKQSALPSTGHTVPYIPCQYVNLPEQTRRCSFTQLFQEKGTPTTMLWGNRKGGRDAGKQITLCGQSFHLQPSATSGRWNPKPPFSSGLGGSMGIYFPLHFTRCGGSRREFGLSAVPGPSKALSRAQAKRAVVWGPSPGEAGAVSGGLSGS